MFGYEDGLQYKIEILKEEVEKLKLEKQKEFLKIVNKKDLQIAKLLEQIRVLREELAYEKRKIMGEK